MAVGEDIVTNDKDIHVAEAFNEYFLHPSTVDDSGAELSDDNYDITWWLRKY